MDEPSQGAEPVVIEVQTERVEAVVDLDDVVGIVRGLQQEAASPRGPLLAFGPPRSRGGPAGGTGPLPGPGAPVEQRLEAISRLAGELADQLAELSRVQRPDA